MGTAMIAVVAVVSAADSSPLLHARNIALLAVGCSGAMRGPSERLRICLPLELVPEGAQVHLHTKTDSNHVEQTSVRHIRLAAGELRPLELVQSYLRLSGHTDGLALQEHFWRLEIGPRLPWLRRCGCAPEGQAPGARGASGDGGALPRRAAQGRLGGRCRTVGRCSCGDQQNTTPRMGRSVFVRGVCVQGGV